MKKQDFINLGIKPEKWEKFRQFLQNKNIKFSGNNYIL